MIYLKLAFRSFKNRLFTNLLTVLSLALSIVLLLSVEKVKLSTENSFKQTVSGVSLLVGARTGSINLALYTFFNLGAATSNISWDSYQAIKNREEVEWTIPYSLGDGHRGFRVVATDTNFYQHYKYRKGNLITFKEGREPSQELGEVVLGYEVAQKLKYKVGDSVVIAHGSTTGDSFDHHADKPFVVVGILNSTGTAIDQSLYISLESMEALHIEGAFADIKDSVSIDEITSFFVKTKSNLQILNLQREINTNKSEPLLAIIPAATLSEIWSSLSQIETVLKIITVLVIVVGIASMMSAILMSLNERRRELAILRSIGASVGSIIWLLVLESLLLTVLGIFLGLLFHFASFFVLSSWLQAHYGIIVNSFSLSTIELTYLLAILLLGTAVGLFPALMGARKTLKDGLTARI